MSLQPSIRAFDAAKGGGAKLGCVAALVALVHSTAKKKACAAGLACCGGNQSGRVHRAGFTIRSPLRKSPWKRAPPSC